MDEKRMAGNYEIIHALHIGEREVVVGYDPAEKNGRSYMTAFCDKNDLISRYSGIMSSPNYAETMELFASRVAEQARQVKQKSMNETRDVSDNRPYDKLRCETLEGCTLTEPGTDLKGKVIVIDPEVLRREYRSATHQLQYCTGGFGASPNSRGFAVFCVNLYNDQNSRFERKDVLAVLDKKALPEWAGPKLKQLENAQLAAIQKPARTKDQVL